MCDDGKFIRKSGKRTYAKNLTSEVGYDIIFDMSNYVHRTSCSLLYTDFDFRDRITPTALLSVAQEGAAGSADELGFGYDALKARGMGFFVVNNACKVLRPVRLGEKVVVETWPLPPRHVFFERHYRVLNEKGEPLALLASRWCLVELETQKLLLPEAMGEVHAKCPYNPEKSMEVNWRIPRISEHAKEVYARRVLVSDCDHYLHVNNARYGALFFDCFSMEELNGAKNSRFEISYDKQVPWGAEIRLFREDYEGESILELRSNGAVCARCRVRLTTEE